MKNIPAEDSKGESSDLGIYKVRKTARAAGIESLEENGMK